MMELNDLKSTWKTAETPIVSTKEIQTMLSENKHPVLKGIRKQFTIEIIGWCAFLACYYTMFDGDMKPAWLNALLVLCVFLPLGHNLMGYRFAKHLVHGDNISESLKNYLSKIKGYAIISVISRQLYLTGFLLFFTYGLAFNATRYATLAVVIIIFLIQLLILCRIWIKRLKELGNTVSTLQ